MDFSDSRMRHWVTINAIWLVMLPPKIKTLRLTETKFPKAIKLAICFDHYFAFANGIFWSWLHSWFCNQLHWPEPFKTNKWGHRCDYSVYRRIHFDQQQFTSDRDQYDKQCGARSFFLSCSYFCTFCCPSYRSNSLLQRIGEKHRSFLTTTFYCSDHPNSGAKVQT